MKVKHNMELKNKQTNKYGEIFLIGIFYRHICGVELFIIYYKIERDHVLWRGFI